jgi:hypothetical protein
MVEHGRVTHVAEDSSHERTAYIFETWESSVTLLRETQSMMFSLLPNKEVEFIYIKPVAKDYFFECIVS